MMMRNSGGRHQRWNSTRSEMRLEPPPKSLASAIYSDGFRTLPPVAKATRSTWLRVDAMSTFSAGCLVVTTTKLVFSLSAG